MGEAARTPDVVVIGWGARGIDRHAHGATMLRGGALVGEDLNAEGRFTLAVPRGRCAPPLVHGPWA